LGFDDERLHEHAVELVGVLDKDLGIDEEEDGDDGDEWQDESGGEEGLEIGAADEDGDAEMS